MRYCFYLAELGKGTVSPNPQVGSILVFKDRIIGEGYHKVYGGPHAEVNAIHAVHPKDLDLIPKSTLYVSLEPCNHYGKTGPCTDFIIKNKIEKLVFGAYDPNPKMAGKSIAYLKQQGLEVIGPVLERNGQNRIREFETNILYKRPYIILKFAQSADFFIGKTRQTVKISNSYSDLLVHKWRSETDGILVGSNTIKIDNPLLTTRFWPGKNPVRIVFGRFSASEKMDFNAFNKSTLSYDLNDLKFESDQNPETLLEKLIHLGIGTLLVEGGAKTIQYFYKSGFWDEARIITNTALYLKEGIEAPSIQGFLENSLILDKDVIHYITKTNNLS
ncbi:MAG: bifunctional diaminohydroxyphosphoribosylaminopyrimidine deaminase/5-amino-6-(5-phosphoribosylamino)uracil reductase RibD [Saprospiraceae bacterium]|nr:bifunctional diaminohydroxyphosphoribosylaminopyrimidine deaminase/5-amino-6-(5-phosphoribosylamino)uracil reductase RibD [Saprospiraceae bacterium]